jgi:hypothetical protein
MSAWGSSSAASDVRRFLGVMLNCIDNTVMMWGKGRGSRVPFQDVQEDWTKQISTSCGCLYISERHLSMDFESVSCISIKL